jgi:hypothetical protein
MFKRGYAFGNWSKFVRPGFQRLNASDKPNAGVFTEAYRDGANHLAIIAINTNTTAVNQKFIVNGTTLSSVTPWVTSPDPADNLAAKSPLTPTNGDFTYTLPAQSVVTFVNWDATTETPGLTLPPVPDAGVDAPHIATCELDCSAAVTPSNGTNGGVTDFSDWSISTGKWGNNQSLYGAIYGYGGPTTASSISGSVDATNKDLHGVGQVASGGYGGIGLSYCACSTVTAFTQVSFTVAGSWPGCDLQMQIKTFDQTPLGQNPMGGCDAGSCYNYPVVMKVAPPSSAPMTVTVPLSSFSSWSAANAAQVVGLQWQWTYSGANLPDSGTDAAVDGGANTPADGAVTVVPTCPVDATVTNVKFLP